VGHGSGWQRELLDEEHGGALARHGARCREQLGDDRRRQALADLVEDHRARLRREGLGNRHSLLRRAARAIDGQCVVRGETVVGAVAIGPVEHVPEMTVDGEPRDQVAPRRAPAEAQPCRHRLKPTPQSPGTRPSPAGQSSAGVDTAHAGVRHELNIGFVKPDHELFADRTASSETYGVVLTIHVDDVDEAYERAKRLGAEIAAEIRNEDCAQRHFLLDDPNGLVLNVMSIL
jgi:uncharacterized glyoxalase superfamily protein PhnB